MTSGPAATTGAAVTLRSAEPGFLPPVVQAVAGRSGQERSVTADHPSASPVPVRPNLFRRVLARVMAGDDDPPPLTDPDPFPAGPFPIGRARARRRVDFIGTVQTAATVEQPGGPWFEATLSDGTGRVTLAWLGRSDLPGVVPGRRLRVKGRLVPDRGRLVVFNPDYALVVTPTDQPAAV
jgi:hypothetical protein